ncbi:GNAT family N-acetyltransferase [Flavobacteriaceae bacterium]|nr:GNAT family N-acetyltransferase [Flavobacteriaceae bacterium]MDC6479058.1 GNAT family N-acetyltransferase [Flavobacteriaceae bacterium]
MNKYKVLIRQEFIQGKFKILPIRFKDRIKIMEWRNEQMYHLRQFKKLTIEDQNNYFKNIIKSLFSEDYPLQILFSYLEDGICIGYGGLVHIDWNLKTAEISFVMDSSLEEDKFEFHWKSYLSLIEQVAFGDLNFKSIFTYAYDLRPRLYTVLEDSGFIKNKVLKNNNDFDVIIHSKNNTNV